LACFRAPPLHWNAPAFLFRISASLAMGRITRFLVPLLRKPLLRCLCWSPPLLLILVLVLFDYLPSPTSTKRTYTMVFFSFAVDAEIRWFYVARHSCSRNPIMDPGVPARPSSRDKSCCLSRDDTAFLLVWVYWFHFHRSGPAYSPHRGSSFFTVRQHGFGERAVLFPAFIPKAPWHNLICHRHVLYAVFFASPGLKGVAQKLRLRRLFFRVSTPTRQAGGKTTFISEIRYCLPFAKSHPIFPLVSLNICP